MKTTKVEVVMKHSRPVENVNMGDIVSFISDNVRDTYIVGKHPDYYTTGDKFLLTCLTDGNIWDYSAMDKSDLLELLLERQGIVHKQVEIELV